jgi:uncharacterized RDD family membrane protein YckC
MFPEAPTVICPTCDYSNSATAKFCTHCQASLAQLTQGADWVADVGASDGTCNAETILDNIQNHEFVKPPRGSVPVNWDCLVEEPRPKYHPLAERTLEKLERARLPKQEKLEASGTGPVTIAPRALPAEPTAKPRTATRGYKERSSTDKVERIEIDLDQGTLPSKSEGKSVLLEDQIQEGLAPAPVRARMASGAIDAFFIGSCYLLFLMIILFIPDFTFRSKASLLGLGCIGLLFSTSYLFLFTFLGDQTLGMAHKHLRVINFKGKPPSLQETSLRCFGCLISLGCFCLGFIWAFLDPEKLTWHDRISKTLIIKTGPRSQGHED